jgi:hypothetical protein
MMDDFAPWLIDAGPGIVAVEPMLFMHRWVLINYR